MHIVNIKKYSNETGKLISEENKEFRSIYNAKNLIMDIRVKQEALKGKFKYETELKSNQQD